MCVCACARVCVCVRACLHACECVYTYACEYVCTCVYAYVYVCFHVYIHKCNKNLTPPILAQCYHTQESDLRTSKTDFFRSLLLCDFPMFFVHCDLWWDNFCLGTKVVPP